MSRTIKLIISDDETKTSVSAETTLLDINLLFENCGINGITEILINVNNQLNIETGNNISLAIPSEIVNEEKEW